MTQAIVNLVTDAPNYRMGQDRLRESLAGRFDGDFFGFIGEDSVGAPLHADNPYAFKVYAIDKLRQMGYELVLWLDASVYAVQPVQPVFDLIASRGFFLEHSGWATGAWANDESLRLMNISREMANTMPMISAGMSGFNFATEIGDNLFYSWVRYMHDGVFRGSRDDHRHDQTALSVAAYQMGLKDAYTEANEYFAYVGPGYGEPKQSAVCHLQGI